MLWSGVSFGREGWILHSINHNLHNFTIEQAIVPSSLRVFVDVCLSPLLHPSILDTTVFSFFSYGNDQTYFEEIKQFYYRDEFSHQVQEWNRQRTMAIERALQQFLYVQMAKELKNKLLVEAKEYVIKVRTETHAF